MSKLVKHFDIDTLRSLFTLILFFAFESSFALLCQERLSPLQVYVCPVCFERLRRRVPGAEPGQRFDLGEDQDPMEVVQRRGLEKVNSIDS